MRKRHLLLFLFLSGCFANGFSQVIVNSYAKVTAINGAKTQLTISYTLINQANHTFAAGEDIVIMQMQDNVLGTTTNTSTFGTVGSIGAAGSYEIKTIASIVTNAGPPQSYTYTLTAPLVNNYSVGANSSLQIISFQTLGGGGNYNISSPHTGLAWDGNIGGVVALKVGATMRMQDVITADGLGFRGGAQSTGTNGGACDAATYITGTTDVSGEKGEGIFLRTVAGQKNGRAKIINGGGGGNVHNAGGGGGGNYETGGDGGGGYGCGTAAGGQGGLSLKSYINSARIFMGGGGGGGHQNNGQGSAGGRGGGIILIKANTLRNSGGGCTAELISANGITAVTTGANDGAGGGGAGGTIVIDVPNYTISAACDINVSANGGTGGTVNDAAVHGGGGGGSQGRIFYGTAPPAGSVNSSTANGAAGCSNTPCSSPAGSPSGTSDTGISTGGGTPLPVNLIYFTGDVNKESGKIELNWATANENNNDFFTLERSSDGEEFTFLDNVKSKAANGNSSVVSNYRYEDKNGYDKIYYYRLSQTDLDGTYQALKVIRVERDKAGKEEVWLYPNPAKKSDEVHVDMVRLEKGTYTLTVLDPRGAEVQRKQIEVSEGFVSSMLELENLTAGVYVIRISSSHGRIIRKLVIK